ncbi:2-dehydro-3-deoxygalactonokinase [Thioclava sp. GXIMD4216]|uniref:2-dehydro-3-deoxygalactonokinase n=1 Tax=Thioclava sp. GXIMD4216 TaxID=3131929 RepID=UPI0030CAB165
MTTWLAGAVDGARLFLWDEQADSPRHIALEGADAQTLMARELATTGAERAVLAAADGPARHIPCKATATTEGPAQQIRLLPKLVQNHPPVTAHPREVALIAGLLKAQPQFDGVIAMTGETTLWAQISAEEVVSVTRSATGRLFAAFGGGAPLPPDAEFDDALSETRARPERLMRALATPALSRQALLGSLIGAELSDTRPWWLGQRVLTFGPFAQALTHALAQQGAAATEGAADHALRAGLLSAFD